MVLLARDFGDGAAALVEHRIHVHAVAEEQRALDGGAAAGNAGGFLAGHARGFGPHAGLAEPVDGAEEARDERRGRTQIDFLGSAELLDAALVHYRDLVGHRERFFLIVRDEEKSDAGLALHGFQFGAHFLAELGIERGQGLVEQQHLRLEHERAGERHTLLLAAGELGGGSGRVCRRVARDRARAWHERRGQGRCVRAGRIPRCRSAVRCGKRA